MAFNNSEEHKRVHLKLTSVDDFIEEYSANEIYLGPWCFKEIKCELTEDEKQRLLPTVWECYDTREQICHQIEVVVHEILPKVARCLNEIHGTNKSVRYWNILVGRFLRLNTAALLNCYKILETAIEKYPRHFAFGLSKSSYRTPLTHDEFRNAYTTNAEANLQYFSQAADFLEVNMERKNYDWSYETVVYKKNDPLRKFLLRPLKRLYQKILHIKKRKRTSNIAFCYTHFPEIVLKRFNNSSPYSFSHVKNAAQDLVPLRSDEIDKNARNLFNKIEGEIFFSSMILKSLSQNMPACYIERFGKLKQVVNSQLSADNHPDIIFLGPVSKPNIQLWVAESTEFGAKLYGVQHGGAYGEVFYYGGEKFEREISDKFITWGWKNEAKDTPLPASRFLNLSVNKFKSDDNKNNILWIAKKISFYNLTNHSEIGVPHPIDFSVRNNYLFKQRRFYDSLDEKLRKYLLLRLRPDGRTNKALKNLLYETLNTYMPGLTIDDFSDSYTGRVNSAKIVVVDQFASTGFLEALALKKPTLVFGDIENDIYKCREQARPYYEELHQAGILHYTPESAADILNSHYSEIDEWWEEPKRQQAIQNFSDCFGRYKKDGSEQWKEFIEEQLIENDKILAPF